MAKRIAVVGGGASAVLLLAHMARLSSDNQNISQIDVYDRVGAFAKGVAYSTTNMAHPLNVRAGNMSGYADVKTDLVEWLSSNAPEYDELCFIPRAVYARYLGHLLAQAQKILPVQFIHADVDSVHYNPGKDYELHAKGEAKKYDEVVIATGNVRPISIDIDDDCHRYYKSPYETNYSAIDKDGAVVILGSGLSAVDAILALEDAGFKGVIKIISSKGLFPARHAAPQVWEAMDTPLNNRTVAAWMRAIRLYIERAVEAGMFWQTAIDSLRAETNPIWQSLTQRQRAIFMRHALSIWNIHRHRMPPESADIIDRLKSEGRMEIIRDRALSVTKDGNVVCRKCVVESAAAVINGLGYRYDEKGRVYDASYKIGPANFGDLFETTAIPEIRAQAADIANKLMQ
jgi:uncharacterized NAD(P)/FAD-binding protein YdhS